MLAGLFIASSVAALLSNLWLVLPWARTRRAAMRITALVGGAIVCGAGIAVLIALQAAPQVVVVSAAALGAADLLWLPVTRRWDTRGHVVWVTTTTFSLVYLAFILVVTLESGLGPVGLFGGLLLWVVEATVFLLSFAYMWEIVDVLARREWLRKLDDRIDVAPARMPFVSLHVPAHNEPPEMVIETLESLLAIDYPAYEIVMLDDNSDDPDLWMPVRDFCDEHGIGFHHLEDWPGYKSGALNYALTVTDPRAEVIGIIDADYLVDPQWLQCTVPHFVENEDLAFVQTPQHYRDWENADYSRRLYYSYEYFFAASQLSRNEQNGAIFAGTMGLIRRRALEEVGGWDEWCITEDAELSLRLLRAGWSGTHVDRAFGSGVMPLTWEALKGQRFRWCFGGIQILRKHWRALMPWDSDPSNKLTLRQRWAYLAGGLQWFGDPLGLILMLFLLAGAAVYAAGHGLVFRRVSGALLIAPAVLLLVSILRAVVVLRRRTGASRRDAMGAFGIWLALSWVVSQAVVRGLSQSEGVFLRTPKTRDVPNVWDALRANAVETLFAALLFAGAVAALWRGRGAGIVSATLAVLLLVNAVALAGAPRNSRAAMLVDLPPHMRKRRATERLRDRVSNVRPVPAMAAGGALAAVAGVLAALLIPSSANSHGVGVTSLVHQIRHGSVLPKHHERARSGPKPAATPGAATSPTPAETVSPTPTPTPSPTPSPSASPTTAPDVTPAPTTTP